MFFSKFYFNSCSSEYFPNEESSQLSSDTKQQQNGCSPINANLSGTIDTFNDNISTG